MAILKVLLSGSTSRDHQPPRFPPTTDHGGKNYHGFAGRGGKRK